jgi:hypothetical protein
MFIQLTFALLLLTTVLFTVVLNAAPEVSADTRAAEVELERLGAFAFATDRYLEQHQNFEGRLDWDELRELDSLPSGLQGAGMPADWYARVADGDYVLCAPVANQTLALLAQRMPSATKGSRVQRGSTDYLVFAAAEDAAQEAKKCAG